MRIGYQVAGWAVTTLGQGSLRSTVVAHNLKFQVNAPSAIDKEAKAKVVINWLSGNVDAGQGGGGL